METAIIKIELHEDERVSVQVNGRTTDLANILASAITGDQAFNEVLTMAMMAIVAQEEHERQQEINKAQLN